MSAASQSQGSFFFVVVVATGKQKIVGPASKKAKLEILGFQRKYSLLLKTNLNLRWKPCTVNDKVCQVRKALGPGTKDYRNDNLIILTAKTVTKKVNI